uniref:hypothetical protein n=1 Tax=Staphylococcus haemolyticus TaxID=1283 RepID=UPI001C92BC58
MENRKGRERGRSRKWDKVVLSWDCSVEVEYMKVEWVVMVDEDGRVNRLGGVVETGGERRRVCKTGRGWSNHLEVGV